MAAGPTGSGNSAGPLDPNYCLPVTVQAGGVYALVVNNSSLSTNGYAIQFAGTANLLDNVIPQMTSLQHYDCDQVDTLVLGLSDYVDCNTVAADGSDFDINGPFGYYGSVQAAIPVNCNANNLEHTYKNIP